MGRLTIDMTDRQRESLEALAAGEGKTIRQYALERLFPSDSEGDRAWDELGALLKARIDAGLAGQVSAKSVDDILAEELNRRD